MPAPHSSHGTGARLWCRAVPHASSSDGIGNDTELPWLALAALMQHGAVLRPAVIQLMSSHGCVPNQLQPSAVVAPRHLVSGNITSKNDPLIRPLGHVSKTVPLPDGCAVRLTAAQRAKVAAAGDERACAPATADASRSALWAAPESCRARPASEHWRWNVAPVSTAFGTRVRCRGGRRPLDSRADLETEVLPQLGYESLGGFMRPAAARAQGRQGAADPEGVDGSSTCGRPCGA
ncbi:MAG TPA: hypothetical protein VNJ04_11820 [Gemmatimonadaceae bacterium]|nr:hypothetical protein [Gemmatimonadaceae bacterium]